MKKLFLAVVMTTAFGFSLLSQVPSVSIKIDTAERFRFEGNRLNFLNPGRNVLIGDSTGFKMDPSAAGNVYIGDLAGQWDTLGFYNTFIGSQAGYSNRTGVRNTFLGFGAGQGNSSGFRNTFVGMWAGATNFDGSYNTYLGRNTGFYNQNGSGNVFIGDNAGMYELGSNILYVANTNTTTPLIYGEFNNAFLRFNAINAETTGDFMAYGKVRANDVFSHNGTPGISDTANYVTNVDFPNSMLKYRTIVYSGGIVIYNSDESDWVSQVGEPIFLCGPISLIGEFSGWSFDHFMTRDNNNPDLWTTTMYLTSENDFMPQDGIVEMKFRENQDWAVNWGSNQFPSGTGVQNGPNIPVSLNANFTTTIYEITFNCETGEYTFTDVSQ
jgi:hypothetical protein